MSLVLLGCPNGRISNLMVTRYQWHPGENVGIGKDHTIYATVPGYVRYYRDPRRHPRRCYIGVALEREGPGSVLPTPPNAASRRRLGMFATPIKQKTCSNDASWLESHMSAGSKAATSTDSASEGNSGGLTTVRPLAVSARPRYNLDRESNWSIGRTAERKGVKVREYDRKDRWYAWRKRAQKAKRREVRRTLKSQKGKSGKRRTQNSRRTASR